MTTLLQHIAFYTLLASPIWGPAYLFWLLTKAVEKAKSTPTPRVETSAETAARRREIKTDIARFAALRAQG